MSAQGQQPLNIRKLFGDSSRFGGATDATPRGDEQTADGAAGPFDDVNETTRDQYPLRLHEQRRPVRSPTTLLRDLQKTTKEEARKPVLVNAPLYAQPPSEYSLDLERGLVSFAAPVGFISPEARLEAPELGAIVATPPPRVRITFAYRDSPAAREALARLGGDTGGPQVGDGAGQLPPAGHGPDQVRHHFSALFQRGPRGPELINPDLREPKALGERERYPLVIHDDGLQLYATLDGRSNAAELERRAREIAAQHLIGDDDQDGEDGTGVGFYAIQPSSRIQRVEWEGGDGVALTRWTIDNPAAAKATLAARIVSGWA